MRAYGSRSLSIPRRRGGRVKWFGFIFVIGFLGGFLVATAVQVRQPVELIISTPPLPETTEAQEEAEVWSENRNISVRIPKPNQRVGSPLIVEGLERTFEQNVVVRLRDGKGGEMVKIAVTGTAPDVGLHGPYRAELTFEKPKTRAGTLEVFQASPKDGSEIDKVSVPVRFE